MVRRKLDKGTRVIVATAGVVVGLAVGIVVVAMISAGGGGGEPQPYQPFFAGTSDRLTKQIKADGPICFPDPREGQRAFCLDLEGDQFIALHVIPPDGTAACPVEWDRTENRYEDKCTRTPVDRSTLARFTVLTREISDKISVFIDVRTTTAPPA